MNHVHVWKWIFETYEYKYDFVKGMECDCGAKLTMDDIEDILNAFSHDDQNTVMELINNCHKKRSEL
jgi:hypothetical protein